MTKYKKALCNEVKECGCGGVGVGEESSKHKR